MTSILDRFLSIFRRPSPMAANDADYDPISDLREQMQRDVASGFYDRAELMQQATDMFEDQLGAATLQQVAASAIDEALTAHLAAQATWPELTDCDRLDSAFAALETEGIITRQNFWCCGTCGAAAIGDEAAEAEAQGRTVDGYAFYHQQDTESAVDGYGLYLNYGAAEEGEAAALNVAQRIVRQIERHGLQTNWDGTWRTRIGVTLDWKRRRLG